MKFVQPWRVTHFFTKYKQTGQYEDGAPRRDFPAIFLCRLSAAVLFLDDL